MASITAERARTSEREHRVPWHPLVVFPCALGSEREPLAAQLGAVARRYLARSGAILFRGFRVSEDEEFERFIAAGAEPEPDELANARRWVWCAVPQRGQRLLLTDRREIYRSVPAGVRRRWAERGLCYAPAHEPLAAGRRLAPIAVQPHTGDPLWAGPEHAARAGAFGALLGARGPRCVDAGEPLRWSVTHADGSALDELDVHEVNRAIEASQTQLGLEARDVLLLDPGLIALSFELERDAGIVVAHEREAARSDTRGG